MDSMRLLTRGSSIKFNGKQKHFSQPLPSAGGSETPATASTSPSMKRKRIAGEDADTIHETSAEDIRRLHHQHKIRITDLKVRHTDNTSESRKAQKQASRLYPELLQDFPSLRNHHVNSALLENLAEQDYKDSTEVQMATIPLLIADDDVPDLLTIAPTGSGKTLAFMIPLINKISSLHKSQRDDTSTRQISAIILAPTRELVTQIVNEGRKLAARTGVSITSFKKGMRLHQDFGPSQHSDSEDSGSDTPATSSIVKSDILVSSPLSLLHAITPHSHTTNSTPPLPLPHIQTLILDEADILLDALFRDQTLSIWSALTNPSLRTSLWSATIGSNIEELAISTLQTNHHTQNSTPPRLLRVIIGLKDTSLPNITHKLIFASTEPGKLTGLRNLMRPPPNTPQTSLLRPPFLIFTQTIPRAHSLHEELKYDIPPSTNPDSPPRIAVLHSSLSATTRTQIMTHFRQGKIWILITTDLLSRGIDFRGVNGVVNYDIPTTAASYVHRAGRTGRAGRQGGTCVTFYTKEDVMYLRPIANVIKKSQHGNDNNNDDETESAIPTWLLDSLPTLTRNTKKDLKQRGVDVRRSVKESDDSKERRRKGRNVIGTRSGYERKLENNRRGMIEGSKRRKNGESNGVDGDDDRGDDEFGGFE